MSASDAEVVHEGHWNPGFAHREKIIKYRNGRKKVKLLFENGEVKIYRFRQICENVRSVEREDTFDFRMLSTEQHSLDEEKRSTVSASIEAKIFSFGGSGSYSNSISNAVKQSLTKNHEVNMKSEAKRKIRFAGENGGTYIIDSFRAEFILHCTKTVDGDDKGSAMLTYSAAWEVSPCA